MTHDVTNKQEALGVIDFSEIKTYITYFVQRILFSVKLHVQITMAFLQWLLPHPTTLTKKSSLKRLLPITGWAKSYLLVVPDGNSRLSCLLADMTGIAAFLLLCTHSDMVSCCSKHCCIQSHIVVVLKAVSVSSSRSRVSITKCSNSTESDMTAAHVNVLTHYSWTCVHVQVRVDPIYW